DDPDAARPGAPDERTRIGRRLRLPAPGPRGAGAHRITARRDADLPRADRRGLSVVSRVDRSARAGTGAHGRSLPPLRRERSRPQAPHARLLAWDEAQAGSDPGADDRPTRADS